MHGSLNSWFAGSGLLRWQWPHVLCRGGSSSSHSLRHYTDHLLLAPSCLPFFPRADQGLYQRERYDRVLLRGGLRASRLQLIGTEPVTPGQPDGQGKVDCLSDHFGLLCTIEL